MTKVNQFRKLVPLVCAVLIFSILAVAGSASEHSTKAKPSPSPHNPSPMPAPKKTLGADLRHKMEGMKLSDGANLIHSEEGMKVFADVKEGKVTAWRATDGSGKALPVKYKPAKVKGSSCMICVVSGPRQEPKCYPIDCTNMPPQKPKQ